MARGELRALLPQFYKEVEAVLGNCISSLSLVSSLLLCAHDGPGQVQCQLFM